MLKKTAMILTMLMASALTLAADFEAGKDYEVLPTAVATDDKSKVEVAEVFWYGCGHCYNFEPMVNAWQKKQDDNVYLKKVPAMWNGDMKLHAKAYYSAKSLNKMPAMHNALFTEMNVKGNRLRSEQAIKKLFEKNGVDGETFTKVFNSFGVNSQVRLAESRARSYRIQGTPEMVVNGKYRVSSSMTGSQAKMLKVVDFLVAQEKAALAN